MFITGLIMLIGGLVVAGIMLGFIPVPFSLPFKESTGFVIGVISVLVAVAGIVVMGLR